VALDGGGRQVPPGGDLGNGQALREQVAGDLPGVFFGLFLGRLSSWTDVSLGRSVLTS